MRTFDDRFATIASDDSVFADTGALDPLARPPEIHACDARERA